MKARFHSWWQKVRKPLEVAVIIALLVGLIALIIVIVVGYTFHWEWTGFGPFVSPPHPKDSDFQRGKTLCDWLQLLIFPLVLAVGGYLFNFTVSRNEQRIASDNQREAALQAYIDKMSELLLHEHLGESPDNTQVESIARARTVTVFRILDKARRISLIQFLSQAGILAKCIYDELRKIDLRGANLIQLNLSEIDLRSADFSDAILVFTNLSRANLRHANFIAALIEYADLSHADLNGAVLYHADLGSANLDGAHLNNADLSHADLSGADLSHADLSGANLYRADLTSANLTNAKVTTEQLTQVKSLKGATMPDGSKYP